MSFSRYPAYKDSGVEWLGEVPRDWRVAALKRACVSVTDGAHISPETQDGVFCFVSTKDVGTNGIDFENCLRTSVDTYEYMVRTGCRPSVGDVLFSKDGTIGRTVVVREVRDFVVASSLIILRPEQRWTASDYLNYLCQSRAVCGQVERFVKGAGLPRISIQNLVKVVGCFPPRPEQASITAFLDRETARIDALVGEQERLIELLKEKRQAVISHAVTKGLDPNAAMKDSGVEWLGKVPAHWTVATVRRVVARIEQGWSPECHAQQADPDEWGVLKAGCVNRGSYDEGENKALPAALDPVPAYEVRIGDVLMSRASGSPDLVGSTAFVGRTRPKLMLSDKVFRLHLRGTMAPRFFVWSMNSRLLRAQIEQAISGAEGLANNLPQSALLRFSIAFPSIDEQYAIVAHLDAATFQVDALITEAQRAIDLLQERRTALITAAVTGQIDVREVEA
jgi:type I restriction enzyme S subunit